jgi:hypothetical protein
VIYRHRLLNGFISAIANGQVFTFSWGPFGFPIRLIELRAFGGDTNPVRTSFGLFASTDASFITGAFVSPFQIPPGWTPIAEPSLHAPNNDDDRTARGLAFQPVGTESVAVSDMGLILAGNPLYLKLLIRNSTGAGIAFRATLVIEEVPDADPTTEIIVRGTGTPAPPPEPPPTPAPSPAPAPAPPPAPGPGPGPPSPPPPPPPGAMPAVEIDPRDPLGSSAAICNL